MKEKRALKQHVSGILNSCNNFCSFHSASSSYGFRSSRSSLLNKFAATVVWSLLYLSQKNVKLYWCRILLIKEKKKINRTNIIEFLIHTWLVINELKIPSEFEIWNYYKFFYLTFYVQFFVKFSVKDTNIYFITEQYTCITNIIYDSFVYN